MLYLQSVEKLDDCLQKTAWVVRDMRNWTKEKQISKDAPSLLEMSFKMAMSNIDEQLRVMQQESNRLFRRNDLIEWKGTVTTGNHFYNPRFKIIKPTLLHICLGIQEVLMMLHTYLEVWQSRFNRCDLAR